jgi:hypothetical protein
MMMKLKASTDQSKIKQRYYRDNSLQKRKQKKPLNIFESKEVWEKSLIVRSL